MWMTGLTSVCALFVVGVLAGNLQLADAKNWRYWSNVGCYEFSFRRTVFFELTDAATPLSCDGCEGSELSAIVNTSLIPSPTTPDQIQHFIAGSIRESDTNTPEECITSCNSTGYEYAAMQDGKTCICTNEQPLAQTSAANCNTACSGNASFSCGGSWVMDVHQNPAYHSSGLTYIGCFKNTFNDLDRMLFEGTYNNFQNNTPEWCVTYCTAGGYDYAGLQYSSQCICSNAGPQGNSDESECTYGCAGDSSINMCGGLGYINIFHTDAHKTTIDDFGCGSTAQDTYYQKWFDDMGHCGITPGGGSGGSDGSGGKKRGEGQFLMTFQGTKPMFTALEPDVNPLPACLAKSRPNDYMSKFLPGNYSESLWSPAIFTLADGTPILCEGYAGEGEGSCMKFNMAKDTWGLYSSAPKKRWGMASDYDPKIGLIMAGGGTNLVHISRDGGVTFEQLANLPVGDSYGQIFFINETTVFFRKHDQHSKARFWILDLESNAWTEGPALKYDRRGHVSAGVVTRSSGEKEVVFMGGSSKDAPDAQGSQCSACSQDPSEFTKKVEIYNVASNTMRDGIDIPKFWAIGSTIPYMDSFIVQPFVDMDDCCGYWSHNNEKSIYRYNDDGTFTLFTGKVAHNTFNNNGGYWVDDLCEEEEE